MKGFINQATWCVWMRATLLLLVLIVLARPAPAHAACISLTSPASGASITRGTSVLVKFSDTCTNRWYECLVIDSSNYACSTPNPQQFTWNTSAYALGNHSVSVRSWTSGGGSLLGSASVTVSLVAGTPTPIPTATPTPMRTATPTPVPTATPTPTGTCISLTSPASGASITRGTSVLVKFSDTCTNRWYECLVIDSSNYACSTPNPQQFTWNTSAYALGNHSVSVRSWTSGGGSLLGSASVTVSLVAGTPTPIPTATPTPVPSLRIGLDSTAHAKFGLYYPATYVLVIPGGIQWPHGAVPIRHQ